MNKKFLKNISNNIGLIFANTPRSYAYLYMLNKNQIIPKVVVYLNNNKEVKIKKNIYFKKINLKKFCSDNKIILKEFFTDNLDNKKVEKYLLKNKLTFFIYSGYGGKIIKSVKVLSSKHLLHSHPGILPEFRGSTTLFYSILQYKKIFCSTIILNRELDNGEILYCKSFAMPKNIYLINSYYDDFIRAKNMESLLLNKKKSYFSNTKKNNVYTVAHPVLRSLAFNKIINN